MTSDTAARRGPDIQRGNGMASRRAVLAGLGRARGRAALERCVGDPDRFIGGYWARRPLHRPSAGQGFDDLFDMAALRQVVDRRQLHVRRNDLRLVQTTAGEFQPVDPARYTRPGDDPGSGDVVDPQAVWRLYGEGASVALQLVDRYWEPLTRFCRDLELFFGYPCQATAYLTPAHAQGLDVHHDLHDVIVLEIFGSKRFRLFRPVIEDPVAGQRLQDLELEEEPKQLAELDLASGEVLYIPRGMPHVASTGGSDSLHVTIGIRVVTWHAVLSGLCEELAWNRDVRRGIPVGAIYDGPGYEQLVQSQASRLAAVLQTMLVDRFRNGPIDHLLGSRAGNYGEVGDWFDRVAAQMVTDATRVRPRPGALAELRATDDGWQLRASGGLRYRISEEQAALVTTIFSRPAEGSPVADANAGAPTERRALASALLHDGVLEVVPSRRR